MAQPPSLDSVSATKLKALKTAETITVWYKETGDEDALIICEALPKGVATAFSTKWKAEFPPINKISVADLQKPAKKSVTVVGGRVSIHKDILAWMLSCCDGKGLRQFPYPKYKSFTYLYLARICAAILGCEYLVHNVTQSMERISDMQIHSEDVRALYLMTAADDDIKRFLAEHVAIRIWEKKLRAKGAYTTLREELPEFNKAIDNILGAKKADRKKERAAMALAVNEKKTPSSQRPQTWRFSNAQNWRAGMEQKWRPEPKGEEVKTGTLKALVVRRGSKGRPAFARLDLGAL